MSTLLASLSLSVLLTLCAVAQQVTLHIRGHITDAATHRAVGGVAVSAIEASHSATTDANGFFSLELREGIKPGAEVRVHIEKEGYNAIDVTEAASETVTYAIQISRPGRAAHSAHTAFPAVKEMSFSTLIPFNDGPGDAIPKYKVIGSEPHDFPSLGLFYARISQWANEALEGHDKPHSVDEVNAFLKEIVRYHILDWSTQLEHDRSGISWDYRTGMKSITFAAIAPPDPVDYPPEKIIELLSQTPTGAIRSVMEFWKTTPTKFRVPAGSTLRFVQSVENRSDAASIEISKPNTYLMTLSVLPGLTLNNYGFIPPYFEATSETIGHIRSFDFLVKFRFELKRNKATDTQVQEQYLKWAQGLFDGLRESIQGPPKPPLKQRTLLLANRIQIFAKQRAQAYANQRILLYPSTEEDQRKRHEFDLETIREFNNALGIELNAVLGELASSGLDTTDAQNLAATIGLPDTIARMSEEMRHLAWQIDENGNLIH